MNKIAIITLLGKLLYISRGILNVRDIKNKPDVYTLINFNGIFVTERRSALAMVRELDETLLPQTIVDEIIGHIDDRLIPNFYRNSGSITLDNTLLPRYRNKDTNSLESLPSTKSLFIDLKERARDLMYTISPPLHNNHKMEFFYFLRTDQHFKYNGQTLDTLRDIDGIPIEAIQLSTYEQIAQQYEQIAQEGAQYLGPYNPDTYPTNELYKGDVQVNMDRAAKHHKYVNENKLKIKAQLFLENAIWTSLDLYTVDKIMKFTGFYFNSNNISDAFGKFSDDLGKIDNQGIIMPYVQNATCSFSSALATKTCVEITNILLAVPKNIDHTVSSTVSTLHYIGSELFDMAQTWVAGYNKDASETPHDDL